MQQAHPRPSPVPSGAKPEGDTQAPQLWAWVEASIWTKRMLAALDNGVTGGRWYSLMEKVTAPRTLAAAWKRVAANKGAAGVDGIRIARCKARASHYLAELERDLRAGRYQPLPARRVHIPKGRGTTRPLGISAVKDRMVQAAVKLVLAPIFARDFLPGNDGFRPGRGCKDALREVDRWLKAGYTWVVDVDVEKYFDSIPKAPLLARVADKVRDGTLLALLQRFLDPDILEGMHQWSPLAGVPQGSVLSPLLSNWYWHPLDRVVSHAGYVIVRYCDDLVLLCQTQADAEAALALVQTWTVPHGLRLHPEKTRMVESSPGGDGFAFLGDRFAGGRRHVRPKSLKGLRDKIRQHTGRTRSGSLAQIIAELNPLLRGGVGYFKHARFTTFRDIDGCVRRRLRALLRKREKRPGFGRTPKDHQRWPNAFFAAQGLFTLYEAYGRARQSR
jgi:RNA-directed DNA polymerase